ncbi:uncharacterized protein TNCT_381101 [Trichonephila clavata]|uniref:Uncharacterized protein n=1 Tax=Trichonephila clavata TaxID=2740835 RepID=A0A8X6IG31_TRICU|nr:uncharacterized protein TNCT_381101 [Trichonephila clavata]
MSEIESFSQSDDTDDDLPTLQDFVKSTSSSYKAKTLNDLFEENLTLNKDQEHDKKLQDEIKAKIETLESNHSLPDQEIPFDEDSLSAEEIETDIAEEPIVHFFGELDKLQFFTLNDLTLLNCGFELKPNLSKQEKFLLLNENQLHKMIKYGLCDFSFSTINQLDPLVKYVLKSMSLHNDESYINACQKFMQRLFLKSYKPESIALSNKDIFTILFNYGVDARNRVFNMPEVQGISTNSDEISFKLPKNWIFNLKIVLIILKDLINWYTFENNDMCNIIIYLLWMSLDDCLLNKNIHSELQGCIALALTKFSDEYWPHMRTNIAQFLMLENVSLCYKWSYILKMTKFIPYTIDRGVELRKYISYSVLKRLTDEDSEILFEYSDDLFSISHLLPILESICGIEKQTQYLATKFIDIFINHLKLNSQEDYYELSLLLRMCENSLGKNISKAQSQLIKMHSRISAMIPRGNIKSVINMEENEREIFDAELKSDFEITCEKVDSFSSVSTSPSFQLNNYEEDFLIESSNDSSEEMLDKVVNISERIEKNESEQIKEVINAIDLKSSDMPEAKRELDYSSPIFNSSILCSPNSPVINKSSDEILTIKQNISLGQPFRKSPDQNQVVTGNETLPNKFSSDEVNKHKTQILKDSFKKKKRHRSRIKHRRKKKAREKFPRNKILSTGNESQTDNKFDQMPTVYPICTRSSKASLEFPRGLNFLFDILKEFNISEKNLDKSEAELFERAYEGGSKKHKRRIKRIFRDKLSMKVDKEFKLKNEPLVHNTDKLDKTFSKGNSNELRAENNVQNVLDCNNQPQNSNIFVSDDFLEDSSIIQNKGKLISNNKKIVNNIAKLEKETNVMNLEPVNFHVPNNNETKNKLIVNVEKSCDAVQLLGTTFSDSCQNIAVNEKSRHEMEVKNDNNYLSENASYNTSMVINQKSFQDPKFWLLSNFIEKPDSSDISLKNIPRILNDPIAPDKEMSGQDPFPCDFDVITIKNIEMDHNYSILPTNHVFSKSNNDSFSVSPSSNEPQNNSLDLESFKESSAFSNLNSYEMLNKTQNISRDTVKTTVHDESDIDKLIQLMSIALNDSRTNVLEGKNLDASDCSIIKKVEDQISPIISDNLLKEKKHKTTIINSNLSTFNTDRAAISNSPEKNVNVTNLTENQDLRNPVIESFSKHAFDSSLPDPSVVKPQITPAKCKAQTEDYRITSSGLSADKFKNANLAQEFLSEQVEQNESLDLKITPISLPLGSTPDRSSKIRIIPKYLKNPMNSNSEHKSIESRYHADKASKSDIRSNVSKITVTPVKSSRKNEIESKGKKSSIIKVKKNIKNLHPDTKKKTKNAVIRSKSNSLVIKPKVGADSSFISISVNTSLAKPEKDKLSEPPKKKVMIHTNHLSLETTNKNSLTKSTPNEFSKIRIIGRKEGNSSSKENLITSNPSYQKKRVSTSDANVNKTKIIVTPVKKSNEKEGRIFMRDKKTSNNLNNIITNNVQEKDNRPSSFSHLISFLDPENAINCIIDQQKSSGQLPQIVQPISDKVMESHNKHSVSKASNDRNLLPYDHISKKEFRLTSSSFSPDFHDLNKDLSSVNELSQETSDQLTKINFQCSVLCERIDLCGNHHFKNAKKPDSLNAPESLQDSFQQPITSSISSEDSKLDFQQNSPPISVVESVNLLKEDSSAIILNPLLKDLSEETHLDKSVHPTGISKSSEPVNAEFQKNTKDIAAMSSDLNRGGSNDTKDCVNSDGKSILCIELSDSEEDVRILKCFDNKISTNKKNSMKLVHSDIKEYKTNNLGTKNSNPEIFRTGANFSSHVSIKQSPSKMLDMSEYNAFLTGSTSSQNTNGFKQSPSKGIQKRSKAREILPTESNSMNLLDYGITYTKSLKKSADVDSNQVSFSSPKRRKLNPSPVAVKSDVNTSATSNKAALDNCLGSSNFDSDCYIIDSEELIIID